MAEENKQEEPKYTMTQNILWNLKRIWFELFALFSIASVIYFTPSSYLTSDNPKLGIISLFVSKFLFVSAGALHAHAIRKWFFPYIKFDKEQQLTSNALLVIVIYAIVIFSWARGG